MQITASLIKSLVFAVAVATLSTAAPTDFSGQLDARSPMLALKNAFTKPKCTVEDALARGETKTLNGNALFWSSPAPPGWGPTEAERATFTKAHRKKQLRPDVWSQKFIDEFGKACSGTGVDIWHMLSPEFARMATGEAWFLGDDDQSDLNWAAERAIIMANPAVTKIIRIDQHGTHSYLKGSA